MKDTRTYSRLRFGVTRPQNKWSTSHLVKALQRPYNLLLREGNPRGYSGCWLQTSNLQPFSLTSLRNGYFRSIIEIYLRYCCQVIFQLSSRNVYCRQAKASCACTKNLICEVGMAPENRTSSLALAIKRQVGVPSLCHRKGKHSGTHTTRVAEYRRAGV